MKKKDDILFIAVEEITMNRMFNHNEMNVNEMTVPFTISFIMPRPHTDRGGRSG